MLTKNKKTSLLIVLFSTMVCMCALLFAVSFVNNVQAAYDNSLWIDSVGEYVIPDEGKVKLPSKGMFYSENLANADYYEEYNALYLKVDYIATKTEVDYLTNQVVFFINSREMTDMIDLNKFGTADSTTMGARTYLQNEEQWNKNQMLVRLCDYANYQTATWTHLTTMDVHSISWLIDSTGVYTYIDDIQVVKGTAAYKSQKAEGELWTIDDFIDDDGNPVLYFGCYTNSIGWIDVEIVKVSNSNGLVAVGGFKGDPEKLYAEDEKVYLKNGYAYAAREFDLTKSVVGQFEIKQVPGYSVDLNTENETFASISIKDSKKSETDGNGFRIDLYPLSEQGTDRTKIEVGYMIGGVFTSYKTIISSYPTVGVHDFALISDSEWYKIIIDGESVHFEIYSVAALINLNQKLNAEETYVFYAFDDKYSNEYSGEWVGELTLPSEKDFEDFRVIGLNDDEYEITGTIVTSEVDIDGKTYSAVTSNKSIEIRGAKDVVAVSSVNSTAIWSKINELIDVKIKFPETEQIVANANSTVTLMMSATAGGSFTPDVSVASFAVVLKILDGNTVAAEISIDTVSVRKEMSIVDGEIVISFGWKNGSSVIEGNGTTLITSDMGTGGFASANGMECFFTAKYVSATDTPMDITFTAPTQRLSKAEENPESENPNNHENHGGSSDSDGETENKKGCGSSIVSDDISVLALLASVALLIFTVRFFVNGKRVYKKK